MHLRSGTDIEVPESPRRASSLPTTPNSDRKRKREQVLDLPLPNLPLKRARLTKRNLRAHCASLAGMPLKRKSSQSLSESTGLTSSGNKDYGAQLRENGILSGLDIARRPSDADEILDFLRRPTGSPVPEGATRFNYQDMVTNSGNERTLINTALPMLLSKAPGKGYYAFHDFAWTRIDDSTVTNEVTVPKPDICFSYRAYMHPAKVRKDLGWAIQPNAYDQGMPYLALQVKKFGGDSALVEQQASQDGATMVLAAKMKHEYMGLSLDSFEGKTTALTVTYEGKNPVIFANHVIGDEYHHYPIANLHPLESDEQFQQTRQYLHNAQDWAERRASQSLRDLRDYHQRRQSALPSPPHSFSLEGPRATDGTETIPGTEPTEVDKSVNMPPPPQPRWVREMT